MPRVHSAAVALRCRTLGRATQSTPRGRQLGEGGAAARVDDAGPAARLRLLPHVGAPPVAADQGSLRPGDAGQRHQSFHAADGGLAARILQDLGYGRADTGAEESACGHESGRKQGSCPTGHRWR
ncbi:hypothetical protein ADK60_20545 [Streptomyces sp. XY431]|nr:hypothetical protein ADK60_20545 [Streptomyces sp. XY431]